MRRGRYAGAALIAALGAITRRQITQLRLKLDGERLLSRDQPTCDRCLLWWPAWRPRIKLGGCAEHGDLGVGYRRAQSAYEAVLIDVRGECATLQALLHAVAMLRSPDRACDDG